MNNSEVTSVEAVLLALGTVAGQSCKVPARVAFDPGVRSTSSGERWIVASALASIALVVPSAAEAGAPPVEVRWSGPPDCPASTLTEALDRFLTGSSVAQPVRVDAIVTRDDEGWELRTDFDAGPERRGTRRFVAPACDSVSQAAALAIALTIDPTVLDRLTVPSEDPHEAEPMTSVPVSTPAVEAPGGAVSPSDPSAVAIDPPAPEPAEDPLGPIVAREPADAMEDAPASPWRASMALAGLLDGGALPGPGGGLAATAALRRRFVRVELTGSHRFATRRRAPQDAAVGGEFSQWTLGLRGCGVPRLGPVELPLCLGADGGQTRGRGTGLTTAQTSAQPWWSVVGEGGLAWPVRPWIALIARGSLAVPLVRQDFSITGLGVVHRVGPAQGRGLVGLELRLP